MDPDQVHNVAFNKPAIGMRGYNEDEVDAFLDLIAAQLQSGAPPGSPGFQPPHTGRSHGRETSPESKGRRFFNGVVGIVRSITD
jgi:DivIVA domain-containing protein